MNIHYEDLETLRELNLPDYLKTQGLTLKALSNGSYQALCPFHDDHTPSLSVSLKGRSWLWHCFGCGKGGDLVKFVMLKESLSFPEASRKLLQKEDECSVSSLKVMKEVALYYRRALNENEKAKEYLKTRGLLDTELIERFGIGFCEGSLPRQKDRILPLQSLGILNNQGREHFLNCIVFPIEDKDGNTVSFYGRSILSAKHLYLPGPHQGLFNFALASKSKRVYLAESIIDALSLWKLGIQEVTALYGTSGWTKDHEALLQSVFLEEVCLCLDNDEAGQKATELLIQRIKSKRLFSLSLPEGIKDLNDFLTLGKTKEDLLKLLETPNEPCPKTPWTVIQDPNEILFQNCKKSYRVRGLSLERLDALKISLRIQNEEGTHLDTFDLYSARQRETFIRDTKKLLSLSAEELKRDLNFLVDSLEKIQAELLRTKTIDGASTSPMTEEERQAALDYLKSPKLIENILSDAKAMGHVAEENNFLLGYLVALSRKLKNPLALFIISQSSAGKTQLQDMVLSFTPPEDYLKLTRLTDQALFYLEKDALVHKLLAIEEEEGARGAGYSIRHLLSAGGLSNMATMKNEETGLMRSAHNEVKGPASVFLTTTNPEINYETYSRFVVLTVDESREQTKRILELQRKQETFKGLLDKQSHEDLKRLHHNIQRLVLPLEVVNPHSESLTFTDNILRARREQKKYLTLIKTIALLRQYQKETKEASTDKGSFRYIEADKEDIRLANRLAREVFLKGLSEMTPQTKKVLPLIKELADKRAQCERKTLENVVLSRRDIREHTGWTDYQLRKQIHELEELEYLIPVQGQNGKRFTYILMWDGSDTTEGLGLSDVD